MTEPAPSAAPAYRQRPHATWVLVLTALVGVGLIAVFTWLGAWQVKRLGWKLDLIERVTQRVHAPPAAAPQPSQWPQVTAADHEYLPVRLQGHWLGGKTLLSQATTTLGAGFWVITPLQQADGTQVLVNRGFVPQDQRARWEAGSDSDPPPGPIEVTGLLRMSEPGGGFLRTNNPAQGRWHSRDVAAMSAALDLPRAAPFFVDAGIPVPGASAGNAEQRATSQGEWPRPGLTVVRFTNTHLVYAVTWFGLALMVAGGLAFVARYELRLRASLRVPPSP